MQVNIKLLPCFYDLLNPSVREISFDSGRGSGKTIAFADATIVRTLQNRIRVLCCREIQNSIEESVMATIADRISYYGLDDWFSITRTSIVCLATGSEYLFKGLSRNMRSLKSLANIDICWIEEADAVSAESLEFLLPTIRKPGSQIWYSWNRTKPEDAVYKRFYGEDRPPNSIVKRVFIKDNPLFPDVLRQQMEWDYKLLPELAAHIWGGELRPADAAMAVLPLPWLKKCVDAHINVKFKENRFRYLGFDVADTGADHNALCVRHGALIEYVEEWDSKFIYEAVDKVHTVACTHNCIRVYFDATGVGSGAKGDFNKLPHDYIVHPFIGGSSPEGADIEYLRQGANSMTNGKFFRNLKAQAWWNVRQRLENTMRFLAGETISPDKCLFISSTIPNLDEMLREMAQPIYEQDNGKLMVDKSPDGATSPNKADAIVLSFAHDFYKKGLKGF